MLSFSSLSVEYVPVQVTALKQGQPYDPTSDTVYLAFKASGNPSSGDWITGTWETSGSAHVALGLIGPSPGNIQLTKGVWNVWVKVTDNPETPVKLAGQIQVF